MTTPDTANTAAMTETEQRNLRAVADVLAFWNTQNIAGVLSFYDESITWQNVALEETYQGKEAVEEFLERLFAAFPDLQFEVTHKIARGDNVAEQWYIRGTHLGPFMGIPPTGKPVEIPGMSMVEMRDAKFVRDTFYFDSGVVLRQVGLLPPLSTTNTAIGRVALWLAVKRQRVGGVLAAAAILSAALLAIKKAAKPKPRFRFGR